VELEKRLKGIQMLLLDVDGVLTTGEIIYTDSGEQIKIFNVKDGLGIRMLKEAGIQVGVITGRKGKALRHRCQNLGLTLVFDGARDKIKAMKKIAGETGIPLESMAFIGDDLPDLSVMQKAGLAVAVADAHEMIRHIAHVTTRAKDGRGAVREICEAILKAQNKWDDLIDRLFG
jgi:3-deoxy-D-manno-octulosonate 8-phosphate phosphatase (KDO 8-P phosphatase)